MTISIYKNIDCTSHMLEKCSYKCNACLKAVSLMREKKGALKVGHGIENSWNVCMT